MSRLTPQTDALEAVFAKAASLLPADSLALEMLEDAFHAEARAGRLDLPRFRGYLQGLAGCEAVSYEDYCEMDAQLVRAFAR